MFQDKADRPEFDIAPYITLCVLDIICGIYYYIIRVSHSMHHYMSCTYNRRQFNTLIYYALYSVAPVILNRRRRRLISLSQLHTRVKHSDVQDNPRCVPWKFVRFCANLTIATFVLGTKLCKLYVCNIFSFYIRFAQSKSDRIRYILLSQLTPRKMDQTESVELVIAKKNYHVFF